MPAEEGAPWHMIVTHRNAPRRRDGLDRLSPTDPKYAPSPYAQVIEIPGGGAPGSPARMALDLFYNPQTMGVTSRTPGWGGRGASGQIGGILDVDVTGTDTYYGRRR